MSCYDYAKQFGTDQFIFTAEGKTAYDKLKADHGEALGKINGLLGKSNEIVYDYTSVYNGFSVVLKESEYKKIWYNKDSLGLKDIYISDFTIIIRSHPQRISSLKPPPCPTAT